MQCSTRAVKFLNEMKEVIPFENLVFILTEEDVYRPEVGKKGGRPKTPAKILLGALFLQRWYSLSDPMTEELIHDRISFGDGMPTLNRDIAKIFMSKLINNKTKFFLLVKKYNFPIFHLLLLNTFSKENQI